MPVISMIYLDILRHLHKHTFTLQERIYIIAIYRGSRILRRYMLLLLNRALHGVEPDDTRVPEEWRSCRNQTAHVLLKGHAQEFHPAVEDEYRGG